MRSVPSQPAPVLGVAAVITLKYVEPRQVYLDPAVTNVADWLERTIKRQYTKAIPRPAYFVVTHPPTEVLCAADLDAPMTSVLDTLLMAARCWPSFVEPFHVVVVYEGEALVHATRSKRKRDRPSLGEAPAHAKQQHLAASYRALEIDPTRNVVELQGDLTRSALVEQKMTGKPAPFKAPSIRTLYRQKRAARERQQAVETATAAGRPPPAPAPMVGARGKRLFSDEVESGFVDLIMQFQAASQPMHVKDVIDMATTVRNAMCPLPPSEAPRPPVSI